MTAEERKKIEYVQDIFVAFSQEKQVGCYDKNGKWQQNKCLQAIFYDVYHGNNIVIKPEPKVVPWTINDVALNTHLWIRVKSEPTYFKKIIYIDSMHVGFMSDSSIGNSRIMICRSYKEMLEDYEYTIDGKTWHPCGRIINE
jgi:hypothetical protein